MNQNIPDVEYRPLPGYEGYRFGSDGSVWSCWKQRGLGTGKGTASFMGEEWKLIRSIPNQDGYRTVNLRRTGGGISRNLLIHHLILLAFGHQRPSGSHEGCHGNGIRTDNSISNIRWGSRRENAADMMRHGTAYRGSNVRKLHPEDDSSIAALIASGKTLLDISQLLHVSMATVKRSCRRMKDAGH